MELVISYESLDPEKHLQYVFGVEEVGWASIDVQLVLIKKVPPKLEYDWYISDNADEKVDERCTKIGVVVLG